MSDLRKMTVTQEPKMVKGWIYVGERDIYHVSLLPSAESWTLSISELAK